jgi:signal transduction histidine kinase
VTFRRDGDVYRLVIADNGVGNGDASAPGIGNRLMGMLAAQLNSTLTFDARSPGLAVVVTIPITKVI